MAKVTQTKDKDFDAIEPRVNFNDMPEERFTKIVQACRDAYSKCLFLQLFLSLKRERMLTFHGGSASFPENSFPLYNST